MIVIDIAQRAAARAYDFHPGYGRRNDADRRPARRVVMPNDGPAPDREARAAAIRAQVMTKTVRTADSLPEGAEIALRTLAGGAMKAAPLGELMGCSEATARYRLSFCRRARLVSSDKKGAWSLNDAGRAWLEANL